MEADGQVEKPYYDDLSPLVRQFNVVLLRVTQGNSGCLFLNSFHPVPLVTLHLNPQSSASSVSVLSSRILSPHGPSLSSSSLQIHSLAKKFALTWHPVIGQTSNWSLCKMWNDSLTWTSQRTGVGWLLALDIPFLPSGSAHSFPAVCIYRKQSIKLIPSEVWWIDNDLTFLWEVNLFKWTHRWKTTPMHSVVEFCVL